MFYVYRCKPASSGMTLIELMIGITVFAIMLMGANILLSSGSQLAALSNERNVAVHDMQSVVTHIRKSDINDVVNPNNAAIYESSTPDGEGRYRISPKLYSQADSSGALRTNLPEQEMWIQFFEDGDASGFGFKGAEYSIQGTAPVPEPMRFVLTVSWGSRTLGNQSDKFSEQIEGVRVKQGVQQ
ncbi:MAG: prepilin-type N-terminal cleavage/methylation domain-containing protein [Planctomycetes bacterium]|nr:prepilin-type N-terminal cleavage/methylation domain-containing protein [Planctomycetota bacterium]